MLFQDRKTAAKKLAHLLKKYNSQTDAIILAIPRGGLELGAILRKELNLPLDIVATKKITLPQNEEYAIGAVDPEGSIELNPEATTYQIPDENDLKKESEHLKTILQKRYEEYRGKETPLPDLKNKTLIVIDDGMATGYTVLAAVRFLRRQHPKKIILAVPVSSEEAHALLNPEVDELICPFLPENFYAVGQFYKDFPQVSDEKATQLLNLKKA